MTDTTSNIAFAGEPHLTLSDGTVIVIEKSVTERSKDGQIVYLRVFPVPEIKGNSNIYNLQSRIGRLLNPHIAKDRRCIDDAVSCPKLVASLLTHRKVGEHHTQKAEEAAELIQMCVPSGRWQETINNAEVSIQSRVINIHTHMEWAAAVMKLRDYSLSLFEPSLVDRPRMPYSDPLEFCTTGNWLTHRLKYEFFVRRDQLTSLCQRIWPTKDI